MTKLEELEKSLKEYQELLKNAQMGYGDQGGAGGTGAQAGAMDSSAGVAKGDDKEDEKKDKELVEAKLDEHNEKKHGEAKDVDSAKKSDFNAELIKFNNNGQWSLNKGGETSDKIQRTAPSSRQDVKITDASGTKVVSPAGQAKMKTDKAAANKAKFESEAKARRAKLRESGELK